MKRKLLPFVIVILLAPFFTGCTSFDEFVVYHPGKVLGDARNKQLNRQNKNKRQTERESKRNRQEIVRKGWRPNYNPDKPKKGAELVGPILSTIKSLLIVDKPDSIEIVGVEIPEPVSRSFPKGRSFEINGDIFLFKEICFKDENEVSKLLRPIANELMRFPEAEVEITVGLITAFGSLEGYVKSPNGVERSSIEFLEKRYQAIHQALEKLGVETGSLRIKVGKHRTHTKHIRIKFLN